jgi:predicted nucleic acid-binding protein
VTWASEPERYQLGRQRLDAFLGAQGRLHAESMSLTLSLGFAGQAGYSDEALTAVETDARDLITAAHALADQARRLARDWRKQRIAAEREQ